MSDPAAAPISINAKLKKATTPPKRKGGRKRWRAQCEAHGRWLTDDRGRMWFTTPEQATRVFDDHAHELHFSLETRRVIVRRKVTEEVEVLT